MWSRFCTVSWGGRGWHSEEDVCRTGGVCVHVQAHHRPSSSYPAQCPPPPCPHILPSHLKENPVTVNSAGWRDSPYAARMASEIILPAHGATHQKWHHGHRARVHPPAQHQ